MAVPRVAQVVQRNLLAGLSEAEREEKGRTLMASPMFQHFVGNATSDDFLRAFLKSRPHASYEHYTAEPSVPLNNADRRFIIYRWIAVIAFMHYDKVELPNCVEQATVSLNAYPSILFELPL